MNVDEAVAALDALPTNAAPARERAPEAHDVAEVEAPELDDEDDSEISDPEDHPTGEDDAEGADDGQPDGEDEEGEDGEPELPAIDPPSFWEADDKAAFANLSREDQERVLKYARKGDAAASKAIQEAAESRKATDAVKAEVEAKRNELTSVVEQASVKFVRQWDGIDWPAWYQQDFQAATVARAQFEQEQSLMKDLLFKKQEADTAAESGYLKAEAQALQDLAKIEPVVAELLDPKEGQARRTEVAQYLVSAGIPADRLKLISASEMALARKAMLYDKAQAALKTSGSKSAGHLQPSPKGAAAPMRSGSRPSASQSAAPVTKAKERLSKTGSVDDAVALLDLQTAQRNRKR